MGTFSVPRKRIAADRLQSGASLSRAPGGVQFDGNLNARSIAWKRESLRSGSKSESFSSIKTGSHSAATR